MRKLPRDFYDRDTIAVAEDLLGKYLVHASQGVERVGRIVEVEAYLGRTIGRPTPRLGLRRGRGSCLARRGMPTFISSTACTIA